MLPNVLYDYLERLLHTRPIFYPRPIKIAFPDGYQPVHLKCYRTARKVQQLTGNPVIAGITFLDKHNKLFPWPHTVNAIGATLADGLVDASPPTDQPNLGFVPIFPNETVGWNEVTSAYKGFTNEAANGPSWGDANADKLTQVFLPQLRQLASVARSGSGVFAIPESIPEAEA